MTGCGRLAIRRRPPDSTLKGGAHSVVNIGMPLGLSEVMRLMVETAISGQFGGEAFNRGDYVEAAHHYTKAIRVEKDQARLARLCLLLGRCELENNQYDRAEEALQQAGRIYSYVTCEDKNFSLYRITGQSRRLQHGCMPPGFRRPSTRILRKLITWLLNSITLTTVTRPQSILRCLKSIIMGDPKTQRSSGKRPSSMLSRSRLVLVRRIIWDATWSTMNVTGDRLHGITTKRRGYGPKGNRDPIAFSKEGAK